MKRLAFTIFFGLLAIRMNAEDARLTEAQVKEIATLIVKELYQKDQKPNGASYDHKSGIWTCVILSGYLGGNLFIDIRDKDAYYRVLKEGPTPTRIPDRFKMNTSLRRRIAKITTKKG